MVAITEPAHPFLYRLAALCKSIILLPRSLTLHRVKMLRIGQAEPRDFHLVCISEDFWQIRNKIEARCGCKARKYGHWYKTTQDKASIKHFYHQMYAPYIQFRFGTAMHLRSESEIFSAVPQGLLLQVYEGERIVSAIICRQRKYEVTTLAVGLTCACSDLLRRGALSTAYYFLFDWAVKHGIKTVDLLRSRANIYDGVFEHKRFWGASPEPDSWPHTEIRFLFPDGQAVPPELAGQLVWKENRLIAFCDI